VSSYIMFFFCHLVVLVDGQERNNKRLSDCKPIKKSVYLSRLKENMGK
jgi:hypothetical protein